ncbi:MAG: phosphatidylserine/phosphatidylglycerophosphate/cardiolipin synthase family protein [Vicinamibacterales bacterium]
MATAFVPLWNRAAEWERRLAMIREARTFLYLSIFYIEYDAYGKQLLAALLDAQRRGVAVNLLVDGFGQRLGGVLMSAAERLELRREESALEAAGGVVTFYRPSWLVQRMLGGGQHVKIQVSDAGDAIFGSSNITQSSFAGWNEYSVAVRGPVVRTLLESYGAIGGSVDPAHVHQLAQAARADTGDLALEYWFCNPNLGQGMLGPIGWDGPNEVTDRLVGMLDSATSELLITSFYFKPVAKLMDAVLRAARRGVHVEVHHSHRDALKATDLAWIAAAANYPQLLEAGVHLYENVHGEHSKIVVVDRAWAAFGTYNFEDAAHDRLAEAMLATRDRRAVEPALDIFDELRRHSDNVRVTEQSFNQLPRRLKSRVARLGRFKRWM